MRFQIRGKTSSCLKMRRLIKKQRQEYKKFLVSRVLFKNLMFFYGNVRVLVLVIASAYIFSLSLYTREERGASGCELGLNLGPLASQSGSKYKSPWLLRRQKQRWCFDKNLPPMNFFIEHLVSASDQKFEILRNMSRFLERFVST